MLCLRLALILGVATLSFADADVDFTTPLSPSTPPELPIAVDLQPEYEDLSEKQPSTTSSTPQPSTFNVGDTLWKCDCNFQEFLDLVKTKSPQDATAFPEIRCQGPEGVMEVWSDAAALKYCPDLEYDHSSSEEYDDDYEEINAEEAVEVADEEPVLIDDIQEDDKVLQEETEAVYEVTVTEAVDATQDVDYGGEEEVIVVFGEDTNAVVLGAPGLMLMWALAALMVIALGVAVAVCRAMARRDLGRRGWATLEEEGGDPEYVKVPLE